MGKEYEYIRVNYDWLRQHKIRADISLIDLCNSLGKEGWMLQVRIDTGDCNTWNNPCIFMRERGK